MGVGHTPLERQKDSLNWIRWGVTVKRLRKTRCDRDSQVHVHSGWMVMSMAFSGPSEGKALGNKNTDNATDERTLAGYGWYCNLDKDAPSVGENKAQKAPL